MTKFVRPISESLQEAILNVVNSEELTEAQKAGTIAASGVNGDRYRKQYLDPHVGSKTPTHTMAKDHGSIKAGSQVKIKKVHVIDGKTHVDVHDEHGNKERVLSTKIHKPTKATENKGHSFENDFIDHLKKHGLMHKDAAGAGSTAGTDFSLINKKKNTVHPGKVQHGGATELNGETKLNHTAAMGQLTIKHDKQKGGWHVPDDARKMRPAYAKHVDKHIIPHLNKHYPKGHASMESTASGRKKSISIKHPNMYPGEAYLKDHHVDVLHVGGGKGTYAVGKDKTGHGLPRPTGKGKWTVRDKSRTKDAMTVMFQPDGVHGLKPSHTNLEDETHVKSFKKSLGHR